MSNLDIAETRLPQDGRIELNIAGRPVDLRVSTLPTMYGESVVMRVLDRGQVSLDLENIGLRSKDLDIIRKLIMKPNGIILVTGPTGSGKTTTLYSCLNEANNPETKIQTSSPIQPQPRHSQNNAHVTSPTPAKKCMTPFVLVLIVHPCSTERLKVQALAIVLLLKIK